MSNERVGVEGKLRNLGSALVKRRTLRGQTQEQISEATSISVQYIRKIERGTGNPSYLTLLAITEALDLTIAIEARVPD